jgi:fused signal recognition particle receptor
MAFNWFKKPSPAPEADEAQPETPAETDSPASEVESSSPTVQPAAPKVAPAETARKGGGGFFGRLRQGLAKTRDFLNTDIEDLFAGRRQVDEEMLEDLEALLIMADIGASTAMDLVGTIRRRAGRIQNAEGLRAALKEEIRSLVDLPQLPPPAVARPHVIMVVGVNGVGKTTTIGKLAAKATGSGKRVVVVAADTFRAAAIEQLAIWAERAGAELIRHKANSDPAAVAYDGVAAAVARGSDMVLIDTAGRLHTNVNLMEELKKIQRTVGRQLPGAPHEVLLVMDATTGQNGLNQARQFHEALEVTGIALTKLDGTAKGGIVVSVCRDLGLPLRYVGVGEQIEDLQPFDPAAFARALF